MRASDIATAECILLFQRGQSLGRMGDQIESLIEYETLIQRAGAIGLINYVDKGLYSLARHDIQRAQQAHEQLMAEQHGDAPWDWQDNAFADVLKRAQDDAAND